MHVCNEHFKPAQQRLRWTDVLLWWPDASMSARPRMQRRACCASSVVCSCTNSASRKLSPRATYLPSLFISIASISRNDTPRCFMLSMNASKSANAEPVPQSPMRSMYAMWPTSETPVAEQYTTRAMGNARWSSMTAAATFVLWPSLPGTKFFALQHGRALALNQLVVASECRQ
jgi:hypothetical protein